MAAASTPAPERVAYIRGGDDGSYIDTGIIPNINTRVVVWARNWLPYSEHLFGSRTAMGSNEFALCAPSGVAIDRMRAKINGSEIYMDGAITKYFSNYHKYEMNGNQTLVDDILVGELIESALTSSFGIHLFGMNDGGTHLDMKYPVDIMACKIYQNDVLVMDLVPVRTPSVGFYDSVSQTTLTNAGSGSFSYNEYNPHAYTPLKYVTSTAEQYADTGIIGGYSSSFIVQASSKASTPKWNIPVSARYSTQKRCEFFFGNTTRANYEISAGFSGQTQQIITGPLYGAKLNLTKVDNVFTVFRNNAQAGTKTFSNVSTSYTTDQPFVIGGTFENGSFLPSQSFEGDIRYAGFGKSGNFVPAMVGGVAGFYDTYNDRFIESLTDKQFLAGSALSEVPTPKTVPYIRGGGDGSYIDTGIEPDSTTVMTIWARNFSPDGYDYSWLAGSRRTYNDSGFYIYTDYRNATGKIGMGYGNSGPLAFVDGWKYFADYHKYELRNGGLLVDDEAITGTTNTSFVAPFSIHIIGINNSGSHIDSTVRLDICACQIYKGGQLVRDFTPRQQNGTVGLYDSVSNTLFTNAGTGSFEYGTFNTGAYTRLEYISTHADAYFDSGVYGKYTDSIMCKFMPTGRTPRYYALLGCRPASNVFDISWGFTGTSNESKRIYWRIGPSSGGTYNVTPYNSTSLTGKEVTFFKARNSGNLYITTGNSIQIGAGTITGVSNTFVSNKTLCVATLNLENGFDTTEVAHGRFYYVRFGSERSFVPALVNNVAGMYDTYNDVFYPSISGNPFIAGPPRNT